MTTLAALAILAPLAVGGYKGVARLAAHEHVPGPHPNGRCWTCGASIPERTTQ